MRNPVIRMLLIVLNGIILLAIARHADLFTGKPVLLAAVICFLVVMILILAGIKSSRAKAKQRVERRLKQR